jgi:hypothetical protein
MQGFRFRDDIVVQELVLPGTSFELAGVGIDMENEGVDVEDNEGR